MAIVSPQTDLFLLQVPLEIGDENQLTFANNIAQYNYFSSLQKIEFDNFTYQRKDNTIRIPANIEGILQYNYVMYRNTAFSNKWFYAFITDMQYLNDEVTAVTIKTDVWQTWQFDLRYKRTFVEREHVSNDTIGLHTVPENLELGDYVINNTRHFSLNIDANPDPAVADKWYVCFVVTSPPEPNNPVPIIQSVGYDIGSAFSPLIYFAVRSNNGYEDAREIIEWYDSVGGTTSDAIKNVYMIPYSCVDTSVSQTWTKGNTSITTYAIKSSVESLNLYPVIEDDVLAGQYQPRNNKLYTWPYSYLYLSNKNGSDVVYRWEDGKYEIGSDNKYHFKYYFKTAIVPSASLSAKLYPIEYKGKRETSSYYSLWNYGINFGKIPICAWVTDYYTNWLTQNGVNIASQVGTSLISSTVRASAGDIAGASLNLLGTVGNSLAQVYSAKVTPDQANGDLNVGDVTFAYTFNNITAYSMTIKKEYSEIIDSYFDAYGYKVNTVKIPNITGRRNWNYVKTIGCYIDAEIPQSDLQEIKSLFDKGITLWHNPATFADYSQNNDII